MAIPGTSILSPATALGSDTVGRVEGKVVELVANGERVEVEVPSANTVRMGVGATKTLEIEGGNVRAFVSSATGAFSVVDETGTARLVIALATDVFQLSNSAGSPMMTLDNNSNLSTTGNITFSNTQRAILCTIGASITAAGTTVADATQLSALLNRVTTVAAATGVKLWDNGAIGYTVHVVNSGANALLLYPPTGSGTINGGGAGAGVSIAVGAMAICTIIATNTWVVGEMPAA